MTRFVESLNLALHRLLANHEECIVLGEDILDPYGGAFKVTKGLSTAYPDRVITTPISEASMTGFATGMALRGFRPIMEVMFGDFLMLCADQIVNSATKFTYMFNDQVSVPLVIRSPMGARRGYGPTHSQTLEAFFLSVPNLNIIAPSHLHNPGALLYHVGSTSSNPHLFIENKSLYPMPLLTATDGRIDTYFVTSITNHDNNYPTISLKLSQDEPEVTLVVYGGMTPLGMEAIMQSFLEEEVIVELLVPSIIKPIPIEDILPSVEITGTVIIAEEGVLSAGWGTELASQIGEASFSSLKRPIRRLGAKPVPIPASRPLEDQVIPQVADLVSAINHQLDLVQDDESNDSLRS